MDCWATPGGNARTLPGPARFDVGDRRGLRTRAGDVGLFVSSYSLVGELWTCGVVRGGHRQGVVSERDTAPRIASAGSGLDLARPER
jgi:hypothetical protein